MIQLLRVVFFVAISAFSCLMGLCFFIAHHHWIDFSSLEDHAQGIPSRILDDQGNEWAQFSCERRQPIDIAHASPHLIQAFIAAEDHAFFEHPGISWKGIVRSLLINLYYGRVVQGASTITQQLVKLRFTDSRRTFMRKLKDQFFALLVEQQFTKEHILQTYLNHVCFGCGIYGVEAASQRFWAKSAQELTLDQAALLAAVVKNPSHYCPLLYPLSSQKRRNIVLRSMLQLGFITEDTYKHTITIPVQLTPYNNHTEGAYFKEMIRIQLESLVGKKRLYSGGLIIQTTLNTTIQHQAEEIFCKHISSLRKSTMPSVDGGLITLDGKTGEIKALIGGFDFTQSQFNRATQARRQMGSVFKPVVYAAALEHGMSFYQTSVDEPITISQGQRNWQPKNHHNCFEGPMTLARALTHSNNIISIKLLLEIGAQSVIDLAQKFHITDTLQPYPSLALGCIDSPLKEVAAMFNVFAQQGIYSEPYAIRWVKDPWGTKIFSHKPQEERALNSVTTGKVAKVLMLGMERARKKQPSQWIASDSIGKTGTTNDSRICWFAGATPDFTTACYVGNDDNSFLGHNVYASTTAFPIWRNLHLVLPCTRKHFAFDNTLQEITIDEYSGKECSASDPHALCIFK